MVKRPVCPRFSCVTDLAQLAVSLTSDESAWITDELIRAQAASLQPPKLSVLTSQ
jgi:hypothetical protein